MRLASGVALVGQYCTLLQPVEAFGVEKETCTALPEAPGTSERCTIVAESGDAAAAETSGPGGAVSFPPAAVAATSTSATLTRGHPRISTARGAISSDRERPREQRAKPGERRPGTGSAEVQRQQAQRHRGPTGPPPGPRRARSSFFHLADSAISRSRGQHYHVLIQSRAATLLSAAGACFLGHRAVSVQPPIWYTRAPRP